MPTVYVYVREYSGHANSIVSSAFCLEIADPTRESVDGAIAIRTANLQFPQEHT